MNTLVQELERVILAHRQSVFVAPKKGEQVVLLFSGGMDSVIAAYMLIERSGCKVVPIYVRRGARAEASELASAEHFVRDIQRKHHGSMVDLLVVDAPYPPQDLKQYLPSEHKATKGHPGRNMFWYSWRRTISVASGAKMLRRKRYLSPTRQRILFLTQV